ncbi:hypothetical protein I4U23_024238 [Adineta vaga]|nr:hypothetical protein I4U23_024238 [Adineta vaga]
MIDLDGDAGKRLAKEIGIYHRYINQCICAPGFYGNKCENSCPAGYHGQICDFKCAGDSYYSKGLLICSSDPYGCSCYSGPYTRIEVESRCTSSSNLGVLIAVLIVGFIILISIK